MELITRKDTKKATNIVSQSKFEKKNTLCPNLLQDETIDQTIFLYDFTAF